jgi:Lrp/AsnC family leucine-responsive transcriptional regulator
MKFGEEQLELDEIDLGILSILQENCRVSLAKIGEQVDLSPPSVVERLKKLEDSGLVKGYHAVLDARRLGLDVTAFIGVSIGHPKAIDGFEAEIAAVEGVLECHHVTGGYTLLLKVKTHNTSSLEALISRIRSIEGVERTETMVVLSTHSEKTQLQLDKSPPTPRLEDHAERKPRRNGQAARQLRG